MKNLPFLLLTLGLVVLGCGGSSRDRQEQTSTVSTPEKEMTRAFDITSVLGKSEKEVRAIMGDPASTDKLNETDVTGEISYDYSFPAGSGFLNFKNGQANYLHFTSKKKYDTYFELGDLIGLDLRGVEPSRSAAGGVFFNNIRIGNTQVKAVEVFTDTQYNIVTVRRE